MIVTFDDKNRAQSMSAWDEREVFSLFTERELGDLRRKLCELPITNFHIKTTKNHEYVYVQIKFDNAADDAFFRVLTADGIEI
jgi:hypothetical protein